MSLYMSTVQDYQNEKIEESVGLCSIFIKKEIFMQWVMRFFFFISICMHKEFLQRRDESKMGIVKRTFALVTV